MAAHRHSNMVGPQRGSPICCEQLSTSGGMVRGDDLRWGIREGLLLGVYYTVVGLIVSGLHGLATPWLAILLLIFYSGTGVLGGVIVGLFRRRGRSWALRVTGGVLALVPALLLASFIFGRADQSLLGRLVSSVVSALFLGALLGTIVWAIERAIARNRS
jgi:hypothetical protein